MAVRSGILLTLDLPRLFWKRLTCDTLNENDIKVIDETWMNNFDTYKNYKAAMPEEDFKSEMGEMFMQGQDSAGQLVDLCENGSKIPVTYANLDDYIRGNINLRFTESKEQYKAIKEGFDVTFRSSYLKMISWKDLELKTVGDPIIDVDRLKAMSEYKNCTERHDVVRRFWRVLKELTNEQKKSYLRFVWGRVRLPPWDAQNIEQHTVQLDENKKTTHLPFGRSCNFRIELPPYTSDAQLKQKLLFAME